MNAEGPKINPGDIILWPMLKLDYDTNPDNIKALVPPGIEASTRSQVHLTVYHFPVPDVPEFGILMTVDADYKGEEGHGSRHVHLHVALDRYDRDVGTRHPRQNTRGEMVEDERRRHPERQARRHSIRRHRTLRCTARHRGSGVSCRE